MTTCCDDRLEIRIRAVDKTLLDSAARQAGLATSEFVRRLILSSSSRRSALDVAALREVESMRRRFNGIRESVEAVLAAHELPPAVAKSLRDVCIDADIGRTEASGALRP
jgi:uncharacterized protein (DUF1778 family)